MTMLHGSLWRFGPGQSQQDIHYLNDSRLLVSIRRLRGLQQYLLMF